MNKKEFKKAMSGVQSSEQTIERIMDMTNNNNTKKRFRLAPALALVACLAILITGIFGGNAITAKIGHIAPMDTNNNQAITTPNANNFFTLTVYAKDNNDNQKEIDLSKDKAAKAEGLRIKLAKTGTDASTVYVYDTVEWEAKSGFRVDGKNIKSATYSAERGGFSYYTWHGNDFDAQTDFGFISGKPYSTKTTINNIGDKECVELFYSPQEAIDTLLKSNDGNFDYSTLPTDIITISVEFNDGSKAEKKIEISFDKNGYMLMKYVK